MPSEVALLFLLPLLSLAVLVFQISCLFFFLVDYLSRGFGLLHYLAVFSLHNSSRRVSSSSSYSIVSSPYVAFSLSFPDEIFFCFRSYSFRQMCFDGTVLTYLQHRLEKFMLLISRRKTHPRLVCETCCL